MMTRFFALFAALLLSACATPEPPIRPISVDFSMRPQILLNTEDLRIIDRSQLTPQHQPYIGHLFSPTLNESIHKMVSQRIRAKGQVGHATFIIKEASVIAKALDTSDRLFTREQAWKYTGRIEVALEGQSPLYGSIARTTAAAVHNVTLPEEPTAYEKQEAYRKLITALMDRLNENLDSGIQKHLSDFLVDTTPTAPQIPPATAPTTDSTLPFDASMNFEQ